MKKLYTTILLISLALFISCDEQKAKDEITKALDKTVDKTTPAPTLTKPVLSATRVRVGTAATFPKVAGYKYVLENASNNVKLDVSDKNTGQVTSTVAESGIVVVAMFEGKSTQSDPIEFVLIELTKPAVSSYRVRTGQAATFSKVLGHTYTLKTATSGVTLSDVEGDATKKQISSTEAATGVVIVATLDGTTSESDPINFIELTKPALSATRVKVGQAATFSKVEAHTYTLKQAVSGVTLSDVAGDTTKKQVSSTEAVTDVRIVATLDDNSIDSDPIEFVEITKPVFSQVSAPWNTAITFPKVPGYTYALKEAKTGVTLSEDTSNTMQVTATQSAQNVIIIATVDGLTEESDPIEFTRIQGNTLSFAKTSRTERWTSSTVTFTETATKSETIAGDTRNIRYSAFAKIFGVSASVNGVTVNGNTGQVTARSASKGRYTITAELQQTAKYERSTATYTLVIN